MDGNSIARRWSVGEHLPVLLGVISPLVPTVWVV
jgi:hypothetical protein